METFGHYHLEHVVGRGAMGEVFQAVDTRHERTVAVKRLRAEFTADTSYQERFRRESRLAARLTSPHVVPIHDFGEIDGRLYLDMRLVAGPDLDEVLDRDGPLDPSRAVEVVRQVAEALDDAHALDLVHRDVKPSNVLLTVHRDRPFAYLADFGIARAAPEGNGPGLTATGVAPGTPAYMAPELFAGTPATAGRATDVYALGCLLVALLTGQPPFRRSGPGLMYDHVHADPPAPSTTVAGVPPALDAVIARAMAKAPGDRYRSAGDLAEAAVAALPARAATPPAAAAAAPTRAEPSFAAASPRATPRWDSSSPVAPLAPGPRSWGAGPSSWSSPPPPPGGGPPTWGSGPPPWNAGPPPTPPPSRGRGPLVALVAGLVALVIAATVTVVVVVRRSDEPVALPPPVTPTTTTTTTAAPVSGVVAVFPDVAALGSACRAFVPAADEWVTASGQRPTAVYVCDYGAVVPGAKVYFAQWANAATAREWYDAAVTGGPALDQTDHWEIGTTRQGPLRYWQGTNSVYGSGAYDDRPYTFDVESDTGAHANSVFLALRLRPLGEVSTG